tara:strand:- start:2053 stop:3546 length:1494 start_codon:yes stop_codon:yes gene_type:complete
MLNRQVFNIIGLSWVLLGFSMILSSFWSIYYSENDLLPLLYSSLITILSGSALFYFSKSKKNKELKARDGFSIVTIGWFTMAIFSALPLYISNFYFDNYFISYLDCYFESMSGLTTTGASILGANTVYIEDLSHGLLFWRSFTQFIGGIGIVLFTIAILPILGMGGVQLFRAEVAGPSADKFTPRVKETAKYLCTIYLGLTSIQAIVLYLEGIIFNIEKLTFFNSLCHSMTTVGTGGFSTFNNSILGFESDIVTWTIIIFMLLGSINFSLHFLYIFKKSFQYFDDSEFKFYFFAIILISFLTFINLSPIHGYTFKNITASVFNTASFMSTTGYTLYNYETWPPLSQLFVFFMSFSGGMAGSTTGGIKLIRTILVVKYIRTEVSRTIHPRGLYNVKIGKNVIDDDTIRGTLGFYLFYILIFSICALLVSMNGLDFISSLSIAASSIGNIGPGLGIIGPTSDWGSLNNFTKLLTTFCMLLGRLEIFSIIVVFSKSFWVK